MRLFLASTLAFLFAFNGYGVTQSFTVAPAATATVPSSVPSVPPAPNVLQNGTAVKLRLTENLTHATAKVGQKVSLTVLVLIVVCVVVRSSWVWGWCDGVDSSAKAQTLKPSTVWWERALKEAGKLRATIKDTVAGLSDNPKLGLVVGRNPKAASGWREHCVACHVECQGPSTRERDHGKDLGDRDCVLSRGSATAVYTR